MKAIRSIIFTTTIVLVFTMCKKSDSTANPTSSFSVNGITYTPGSQGCLYDTSTQLFYFTNTNKDTLMINFLSRPMVTGNYAVINDDTDVPTAKSCGVDCIIGGGLIHDYYSIGKAGDSVYVTVATNGKLTAQFTNLSLIDTTNTVKVSGILIEQ